MANREKRQRRKNSFDGAIFPQWRIKQSPDRLPISSAEVFRDAAFDSLSSTGRVPEDAATCTAGVDIVDRLLKSSRLLHVVAGVDIMGVVRTNPTDTTRS